MGADDVEDVRAWQRAYEFKLAIYRLIRSGPIATDFKIRDQLHEAAASAVSQIEEGFARFYPKDFARFVVGAKASMCEGCGHPRDAVDRGLIAEEVRLEHDRLGREALKEIVGLIEYLQSPEAEQNAARIKATRAERRRSRRANREPAKENDERRTENREPRTRTPNKNPEPGTGNPERK